MRYLQLLTIALLVPLAGCIQQSDTRSFYLHGDGKIELLLLLDNVHSSEPGARGAEEEKKWLTDFRRGATPELKRLKEATGRPPEVRLLRSKAPFSAVIQGSLEKSRDLGVFLDLSPTDPKNVVSFVKDGKARTLSIHVEKAKTGPVRDKEKPLSEEELEAVHQLLWRFIPLGGTLTSSKACVISQDRRSCLLDVAALLRQDRASGSEDFSISWRLD